jgi:hypothetical protein
VSGQRHAPTALYPRGNDPGTHWIGGWVGLRAGLDTEVTGKIFYFCRGSNLDRPVVQSVARHYTNWATPAPNTNRLREQIMKLLNSMQFSPLCCRFLSFRSKYSPQHSAIKHTIWVLSLEWQPEFHRQETTTNCMLLSILLIRLLGRRHEYTYRRKNWRIHLKYEFPLPISPDDGDNRGQMTTHGGIRHIIDECCKIAAVYLT